MKTPQLHVEPGAMQMSAWQFTGFRILLGSYLAFHFAHLLEWSPELFASSGVLADPRLNLTWGIFPNLLWLDLPDWAVQSFVGAMVVLSVFLTIGLWRIPVCIGLWFGWACLFHRNNLIINPSLPYIGLLLILCTLIPAGEPMSFRPRTAGWRMPRAVFISAWILMAVGYTFSGLTKLDSPSWIDGSALVWLLENPLARPGILRDLLLAFPEPMHAMLTYGALLAEIAFLPLCLCRFGRFVAWGSMVAMHLGIVLVVDFSDLSLGMLMLHAFTFDPKWFPVKQPARSPAVVAFDGSCLMCNGFVRFLVNEDRHAWLTFTTLDSSKGAALRAQLHDSEIDSILFSARTGMPRMKSNAVIGILSTLGGHWRAFGLLLSMIPRPLRDFIYDGVAARRHWLSKTNGSCPLPGPELLSRLEP